MTHRIAAILASAALVAPLAAGAQGTLRIAMTASDIPTTTGMPNNGFEGMRFLGYPIFESLILWDLSTRRRAGRPPPRARRRRGSRTRRIPTTWIFTLRQGVKFHDGEPFDADAFVWNMERFYNDKSKQFEAPARRAHARAEPVRQVVREGRQVHRERDDDPAALVLPAAHGLAADGEPEELGDRRGSWQAQAKAPAGTGPFKLAAWTPRERAELVKNADYWDKPRIPKLDKIVLLPMPEANTRVAALRSGQVDWIEVPPPDAVASLKSAGFNIVDQHLPALLAVDAQHGARGLAVPRPPRAPGAQLLRRPRGDGEDADGLGGAVGRLLPEIAPALRQPDAGLHLRPGRRRRS